MRSRGGSVYRLSNGEELSVAGVELDDERAPQRGAGRAIAKDDPARMATFVAARSVRHMDRFVAGCAVRGELANGERARTIGRDSVGAPRRILRTSEPGKQQDTDSSPRRVEQPEAPQHASYDTGAMTRDEIERQLVAIVQKEKNVPVEKLTPDTPLAEAGIDSLDSLTILFAIEEQFHISIPDDDARSLRTFGDMVDVIQRLSA